jgi:hypothetical protein
MRLHNVLYVTLKQFVEGLPTIIAHACPAED